MTYQTHATVPAYTLAVWADNKLQNRDAGLLWSRPDGTEPPAIGTLINVSMNRIGQAMVTGYFEQDGWLGLLVKLLEAPEWHRKQNKGCTQGHIFGPEFEVLATAEKLAEHANDLTSWVDA